MILRILLSPTGWFTKSPRIEKPNCGGDKFWMLHLRGADLYNQFPSQLSLHCDDGETIERETGYASRVLKREVPSGDINAGIIGFKIVVGTTGVNKTPDVTQSLWSLISYLNRIQRNRIELYIRNHLKYWHIYSSQEWFSLRLTGLICVPGS